MRDRKNHSHAILICGEADAAERKAIELASALLCSGPEPKPCGSCRDCRKLKQKLHPDFITVDKLADDKGKPRREIYVDQIRQLAAEAQVLPNESQRKVYLIRSAGDMNASAQNAFLKLLEEPPLFVTFLLLCLSAEQLLETVRSRCETIYVRASEDTPSPQASALSEAYFGFLEKKDTVGLAAFLSENNDLGLEDMAAFAEACLTEIARRLSVKDPAAALDLEELLRLSRLWERIRDYLRVNVSVKHICGLLSVRSIPRRGVK